MEYLRKYLREQHPRFYAALRFLRSMPSRLLLRFSSTERIFSRYYRANFWNNNNSRSGRGSTLEHTQHIRSELPRQLERLDARTLLDIPCGDFFWMKEVSMPQVSYIGADIVDELIQHNNRRFGNDNRRFLMLNLLNDTLPQVDVILCRDCLVHFSNRDIFRAIERIKESRSKYLLTTIHTKTKSNSDILTGEWRPVNLLGSPFHFPEPRFILNEKCPDPELADKSLGLWDIAEIPPGRHHTAGLSREGHG